MPEFTLKLYSPLTADHYGEEVIERGEILDRVGPMYRDGKSLAEYASSIIYAINERNADGEDFVNYLDLYKAQALCDKVISIIPSAELVDGELMGCATVKLRESLNESETAALCDYVEGIYADGWGTGLGQTEIFVDDGSVYVHFWSETDFYINVVVPPAADNKDKTAGKDQNQPQRPKMKLVGMDGNIFCILGTASRLLRGAGQAEQAKEMEQRVQQSHDYYKALGIISEYVETELSGAVRDEQKKSGQKKGGEAR